MNTEKGRCQVCPKSLRMEQGILHAQGLRLVCTSNWNTKSVARIPLCLAGIRGDGTVSQALQRHQKIILDDMLFSLHSLEWWHPRMQPVNLICIRFDFTSYYV